MRYWVVGLFLVLLVLGLGLRFYRINILGTFRADQAMELTAARNITLGKFTLIGVKTSTSEVRNGAVIYYLLAPLLFVMGDNPIAGALLQSILSVGAASLVFFTLQKRRLEIAGLLAGAILLFSPLLVQYSRQTLLAYYPLFFQVLAFVLMLTLMDKFRAKIVIGLGFILGFAMQIHYSTLGLVATALLFPAFFLRQSRLKYCILLAIGFLVGFLPMILFEIRHEFFNTKMFLNIFVQPSGQISLSLSNLLGFWSETVGRFFFGENRFGMLILSGALLVGLRWRRQKEIALSLLFATGAFLLTVIFQKDLRPSYLYISHYAIGAFIPLAVMSGFILARILQLFSQKSHQLPTAAGIISLFILINWPSYRLGEDHGFSMHAGWTLEQISSSAKIIQEDSQGKKYNVAMLVDGESRALPWRYFLDFTDNPPLPVENYSGAGHLYLAVEPGLNFKEVNLWEISSFGSAKVGKKWILPEGFQLLRLEKDYSLK